MKEKIIPTKRIVLNFEHEGEYSDYEGYDRDIYYRPAYNVLKTTNEVLQEWLNENPEATIEGITSRSGQYSEAVITIIAKVPDEIHKNDRHPLWLQSQHSQDTHEILEAHAISMRAGQA